MDIKLIKREIYDDITLHEHIHYRLCIEGIIFNAYIEKYIDMTHLILKHNDSLLIEGEA